MARSINPDDYQRIAQPVAAMLKAFPAGYTIDWHVHERDQLIHAATGTMRVRTPNATWIVPPDRAVYMPATTPHAITMAGAVEMTTLYISPGSAEGLPGMPQGFAVSELLRALIRALIAEPVTYQAGSRADRLSALALEEISRADALALSIPMPSDPRLLRICQALMSEASDDRSLDAWADEAGASGRTLARLFRAECEMGFAQWRQRVRFHYALEALGRGRSVAAVARDVGYNSPSAFTAAFRRELGMPPTRAETALNSLAIDRGLD